MILYEEVVYALFSLLVMSDDFATPWTVGCQAPLSMGFFSGKDTGVCCHFSPVALPWRVRELEKVMFRIRRRPALYRNRSSLFIYFSIYFY